MLGCVGATTFGGGICPWVKPWAQGWNFDPLCVCLWLFFDRFYLPLVVLWTLVSAHDCTVTTCVYPGLYCDPLCLTMAVLAVAPRVCPWLCSYPLCLRMAVLWPPVSAHGCTICDPFCLPMAVLWPLVSAPGCTVTPVSAHGCTVTPVSAHGCTVTPVSAHGSETCEM